MTTVTELHLVAAELITYLQIFTFVLHSNRTADDKSRLI